MTGILIITVLCAMLGYSAWQYALEPSLTKKHSSGKKSKDIFIILGLGFIIRLIFALLYEGHATDMNCFSAWADRVFADGLWNFYKSEQFSDYPPGYMYILYIIGALKKLFSLEKSGFYFLLKLPAIIADILSGYFIYSITAKKLPNIASVVISALYVFNPAVIVDSALWGQVDSIYTLLVAVVIWLITEKRLTLSYFVFAVCVLIKPQALIYTPLIAYGLIDNFVYPEFDKKGLLKSIGMGIVAIAFMFLLMLPFDIREVIDQYIKTLAQYPHMTVNAFNLWGVFGKNWADLTPLVSFIGYAFLVLIVAYATYVFFKCKDSSRYFYSAAILAFFTFMLSTKMHERYGFPALLFLVLAYAKNCHPQSFVLYLLVTLSQFFNIAWVLFVYPENPGVHAYSSLVNIASVINMALLIYMIFVTQKVYVSNSINTVTAPKRAQAATVKKQTASAPFSFKRTKSLAKITKTDLSLMLIITVIYSAIALYDLGDMSAPQTNTVLNQGSVKIDLGADSEISKITLRTGDTKITSDNQILVGFLDSENKTVRESVILNAAEKNTDYDLNSLETKARYVTILSTDKAELNEVIIYNGNNQPSVPSNKSKENINVLFDSDNSTGYTLSSTSISLDKETNIASMKFFLGAKELNKSDRPVAVTALDGKNKVVFEKFITHASVFYWNSVDINKPFKKIILSTTSDNVYLHEIGFHDANKSVISPASYSDDNFVSLFDEQDTIPTRPNFRNGTYFDEIYHARTGYEFVNGMSVYEWTHPPLGKVFISWGIKIFGMCPFGWRIAGTIFGIFMVPLMYIFAKKLFGKTWLSVITCLIFTFDFMHFAQTRIATIDVYVTFFIILMYLFMFKYYSMSFYDSDLKDTLIPLAFCGISMGLGIASKWTGMYAGAGLAIIFFYTLYVRYSEYCYALSKPDGETDGISHAYVIKHFKPNAIKTIVWCCIFFVIVPAIIYCVSYIPYLNAPDAEGFKTILNNQEAMLTYHGSTVLGSEHPFSSKWYEWIIMKRPIWYYSDTISTELKEGISSFGNPLVWWLGIPALILMIVNTITKKDKIALFFVIAYFAQLVPWMFVERLTFIYHYFPCVPFIVLMIGYSINVIFEESKGKHYIISDASKLVKGGAFIYAALVILLFIMFYPVLSGQPCSPQYAQNFLKWFNSWVLL